MHVHFGSLADICSAKGHVRFTPNSDRESEIPQKVMSALPRKADMCSALAYVCFGPIADIGYRDDHALAGRRGRRRFFPPPARGIGEITEKA